MLSLCIWEYTTGKLEKENHYTWQYFCFVLLLNNPNCYYCRHGGDSCAEYLKQVLHSHIEDATVGDISLVLSTMRQYGKDWSRYTPSALGGLEEAVHRCQTPSFLSIDERITMAFLKADRDIRNMRWSDGQGSTACTVLLWDTEGLPFWSHDSQLHLVVSSVGDSKAILCRPDAQGGTAHALNTLQIGRAHV